MATKSDYIDAVKNGATTAEAVSEQVDVTYGYTCRVLKDLSEEGRLVRERDGSEFVYRLPTKQEAHTTPQAKKLSTMTFGDDDDEETWQAGDDGLMPVNRDYDWDDASFSVDADEYFASNGELARLTAQIDGRGVTGSPVRGLIDGPTGCGKTSLAENIAEIHDAVWIEIQMSQGMTDADLLGAPTFAGGQTMWVDGPITKALLASQDRTVVLLIDEVNRAPAYVKNALFSALDHRGAVRLDGPRGGEVIQGNPLNIIVLATMNQGDAYHGTERMDLAEKTRYTSRFPVDYLASDDTDTQGINREAELLVRRTPLHADLARELVEVAAQIRTAAKDASNRTIQMGVPTRSMLAWGARAYDYNEAGIDNPVIAAGEDTIAKVIYGDAGMEDAFDEVMGLIEDNLGDVPFEEDEYAVYADDESVVCADCDWMAPKTVAEDDGVLATAACPECGSGNIRVVQQ